MVDVHVEAHADGVGRDEEIDFAGLEELDLGVAGAGRERPHHHRRAAAMPADQFGVPALQPRRPVVLGINQVTWAKTVNAAVNGFTSTWAAT